MQFLPTPSRDEFLELARDHSVIPVHVTLMADRETPVSAFEKLVGDRPGFLLESVEGGEHWARWSFLGWDAAFTITSREGATQADGMATLPSGDPLEVLSELLARFAQADMPGLPPLHSGAVGYLSYDIARYIENLPDAPPDDRGLPEMLWQFVGSLAALDRFGQTITIVRNVYLGDDPAAQYEEAISRLEADVELLGTPLPYQTRPAFPTDGSFEPASVSMTSDEFEAAVMKCREYIRRGDAYQVVLSQRHEVEFDGDPFAVYRALRVLNPSPFLFFLRDTHMSIVGSSPELMTRVREGRVYSRPIAGTRRRGSTAAEDEALEAELLSDPKEQAEHVMLVDLARNDLGRVCEFGSVEVDDLMTVERYSHVMHIVSGVSGRLRANQSPVNVLRATFPHGTVSGAPKVRAMEIIDELEPVARGPYAGAVGYIDFSGNVDTAICLRTVIMAPGKAWVQAGAGIVYDSVPASEYQEALDKAAAALQAVAYASHV